MVLCGAGGVLTSNDEPRVVELLIVVRTSFARRTAPSTFSSPAPCSNVLKLLSCCAEYIMSDFTRFGVSVGFTSSINAAVPAASGADSKRRWFVAGRMNLTVDLLAGAILAIVAGGGDHEDALIDEFANRHTQWIEIVRVDRGHAETPVDYAHVVGRRHLHQPVQRRQHARNRADAF